MKKKILAGLLAASIIAGATIPAYADVHTEDGSAVCVVTATVASSYTVSLPATLALSKQADVDTHYAGTYTIGAKGNIDGAHYVEIVPTSSFTMTGSTTSETVTATVSQSTTKWKRTAGTGYAVIGTDSFAETTGSVDTTIPVSDTYSGNMTFTFGLKSIS